MKFHKQYFSLKSKKREQFISISSDLNNLLEKVEAKAGLMKIFIPHTTAAITINQNANPDVVTDINTILSNLIPQQRLLNVEKNSDAHFKSSIFGSSLEIPFEEGKLDLGEWQGVFFCEFDGPRTRNLKIQIWSYE